MGAEFAMDPGFTSKFAHVRMYRFFVFFCMRKRAGRLAVSAASAALLRFLPIRRKFSQKIPRVL